jgi:hypothetical protein
VEEEKAEETLVHYIDPTDGAWDATDGAWDVPAQTQ